MPLVPVNKIDDRGTVYDIEVAMDDQVTEEGTKPVKGSGIYDFVNSSVATNTANFVGTYNSLAELEEHIDYQEPLTNNDYGFVVSTDSAGNTVYSRYKYNAENEEWMFEYDLNNSSFTANQWETINSGVTSTDKSQIATNTNNISNLQSNKVDKVAGKGLSTNDFTDALLTKLNGIEAEANKTIVDSSLSNTSENPVQNKVVKSAVDAKYNSADMIPITWEEWEAMGDEKYNDHKLYFIPGEDDPQPYKVYGFHIDPTESDPSACVTYLEDAIGMTPASMGASEFSYGTWGTAFFMPKPCMIKYDGTVDYYLDPNDYTKKEDGTASDVANANYEGNAMMQWPLIYYKYEAGLTAGEGYFYVSNHKMDNSYHCWCNYDCDGNIIPYFYTAIYNGTGTTKLRSISGVTLNSSSGCGGTTGQQEIDRATANNTTTGKVEWYTDVFSDRMLINGLLILISKNLNCQAAFGNGLVAGSQSAKEAYVTGSLNDKGLFWGDITNQNKGVKVFGMENWWGCVYHRTAGCVGLSNGTYAIKHTWSTVDGTTSTGYNSNGTGYTSAGTRPGNSGQYIKQCTYGNDCYLPSVTTGASSTTYYCDYWYTNNAALTYLLVGGSSYHGVGAGFSYFYLSSAFAHAGWYVGACLSLKPLAGL